MIGRASTAMSIKIHQCTLKLTTMKLLYEMHLNKAISKAWHRCWVWWHFLEYWVLRG